MEMEQNIGDTAVEPAVEPSRAEIDALTAPVVIEFGTSWCTHCQAAQPLIAAAFAKYPAIRLNQQRRSPGFAGEAVEV
jgi:thioredoxin 1